MWRDARGQPRMLRRARWQPMFAPCREMNKRCCAVVFLALPLSLSAVRCLFINVDVALQRFSVPGLCIATKKL